MSNDFDYAHNNKNVIWMSQNTNHLPTHGAIQEAITKASDEREYTKYPPIKRNMRTIIMV